MKPRHVLAFVILPIGVVPTTLQLTRSYMDETRPCRRIRPCVLQVILAGMSPLPALIADHDDVVGLLLLRVPENPTLRKVGKNTLRKSIACLDRPIPM